MKGFLTRLLISAFSLAVACYLLPGLKVDGVFTLFLAAFLFGIVNAVVKPLLVIVTFPFIVLSLGLFLFVINGLMLALTAALLPGFSISGFGSAVLGWLIISLTSWVASQLFRDEKQ
jgi:putative membrane protein